MPRRTLVILVGLAALVFAGVADAAQLVDRNATHLQLRTNTKNEALLTYRKAGKTKHILVWRAINAAPPVAGQHLGRDVPPPDDRQRRHQRAAGAVCAQVRIGAARCWSPVTRCSKARPRRSAAARAVETSSGSSLWAR